ncbi:leucine-rich repeat-containing protein 27-like [Eucyclogobius newberryi]|uniref:leucine-rich repeat-containing protein 27-like n=1 Tax=Eucyclogobius newberryi TaxID=166745 RepID=UPI003B5CE671
MLFPVEDVTDSDLQLRLSIGDDADRPPTPDGSRGDDEDEAKEMSARRPPETLTLSRNALREVSGNLLKNRALKYLYLEGNELRSIPPSLFTGSPNLLWLDLRHNQIQSVPTEIGRHRCLRTLLLEGNPITELPPELGNVLTLSGLNIRDCPLRYPPRGVLQRGVFSILQYLRAALAQRPVSAPKSLPDPPVVERLQLELMESGVDEDEEDELERFRELKLQMSLMETAEQENAAKPGQARAPPTPQRPDVLVSPLKFIYSSCVY